MTTPTLVAPSGQFARRTKSDPMGVLMSKRQMPSRRRCELAERVGFEPDQAP
jgi:hypothetical protein